jgi:hypothetical protein
LYSVEEVNALAWTYGGHPTVTGGHPTPQFRVSINKKSAGFAVPDTGTSWMVIPQSTAQQHRLQVDTSSQFTLRAANRAAMLIDRRTTFLLSTQGHTNSSLVEVQALVCPGAAKIYVGWEALIALGMSFQQHFQSQQAWSFLLPLAQAIRSPRNVPSREHLV